MTLFHAALLTFFTSMVPVLELRVAIPMGVAGGLPVLAAMVIAMIGNLVPIPILIVFTRKVFDWLKTKGRIKTFVEKLEAKAHAKSELVHKYEWWGLCILVAIPLPGTGAWTGALVADVLDIRMKTALPAIFTGVCIAGVIVALVTAGVIHLF